jgi:hypothetical protein
LETTKKYNYLPPDSSVLYHDHDPALTPIRLSLPHPPKIEMIAGYGMDAKDQVFKRNEMPPRLKRLEEIALQSVKEQAYNDKSFTATIFKVQMKFWETISEQRTSYNPEIKWIKNTWWHIINGYWFFNNGKPTYITGWHYFYLNFWNIDGQFYPDYRDRDRKEFLFFDYAYTTKETFANLDNNGMAIPNDDGTFDMVDMPNRTCFGVGQNKHRRSGNTNKGLMMVWLLTSTHKGTDGGGIMSMSGDNATAHMKKKLLPSWRKMPLFIKPLTSSSNDPNSIVNQSPRTEIGIDCLENAISAAGTASSTFFDGKKLWALLIDESGKCTNLDVRERHGVLQHCISQGNGTIIFGFEYQPSTAEELTSGGKEFKGLLDDSCFYKRNPETGQTRSGLFRIFIPADEGLDGFIDKYGNSVHGKVLTKEHKELGFKTTATIALESERKQLLHDSLKDPEAMVTYRMKKKQFPLCYDDSWIGNAGDIGFDLEILDRRLAELSRRPHTVRYDLEWIGEPFRSGVKAIPNPLDGSWYISKLPEERERNKMIQDYIWDVEAQMDVPVFVPRFPDRYTCGADPFAFKSEAQSKLGDSRTKKKSSKASDGGIAVFWHRDFMIDPEKKNISEYESNRFVCTYRNRPVNNIIFAEDVLKTCIFYGAMCFPEMNIRIIWEKFVEWGYTGFLKYGMSLKNGEYIINKDPGVTSLERSKQEGFNEIRNHISLHGGREQHEDLLVEWKNINSMEEMTKYDLLAASMCALLGAKSSYHKLVNEDNNFDYNISKATWF